MAQAEQVRKPTIAEILISDDVAPWRELGFQVHDGAFAAGSVHIRLQDEAERGISGWTLRDALSTDLDGLPTRHSREPLPPPATHPNGVLAVDHLVAITPSLDRTAAALDDAGIRLRRVRELGSPRAPSRQGFFRLGEVILEIVQPPPAEDEDADDEALAARPARFWGLVFTVADLPALARRLGHRLGRPRDAVQAGRTIATLRSEAGAACPVAFITPEPARAQPDAATRRAP